MHHGRRVTVDEQADDGSQQVIKVIEEAAFVLHSGGQCPVDPRQLVRVLHRDGQVTVDYASEYLWTHLEKSFDVVGYCPAEPKLTLH